MAPDRMSGTCQWLRVRLCAVSVSIGVLLAVNAQAAPTTSAYPTRPIRLVVPFPPGSPSDVLGRIVSQQFTQALGRPLVIDNRPGAAGVIGAQTVAKAAPDGYTLLMGGTGALAINPGLRSNMPYDPLRDFSPISLFAKVPFILVVSPSIPAATVQELIAILRTRPRQFNYASTGVGSPPQLAAELFKSMTATDLIHIPYKGTDAAAVDLISGQTHLMFSGITVLLPHVKAGRLRALAVASDTQSPLLQQLPTLIQSGCPASLRRRGRAYWHRTLRLQQSSGVFTGKSSTWSPMLAYGRNCLRRAHSRLATSRTSFAHSSPLSSSGLLP